MTNRREMIDDEVDKNDQPYQSVQKEEAGAE